MVTLLLGLYKDHWIYDQHTKTEFVLLDIIGNDIHLTFFGTGVSVDCTHLGASRNVMVNGQPAGMTSPTGWLEIQGLPIGVHTAIVKMGA